MKHFGLLGFPLSHSFSVGFFSEKFAREGIDADYHNFPLPSIDEFPSLLEQHPDLSGLNVTIPYKQAILPFLHAVDQQALAVGAVNVIRVERQEVGALFLTGFNTDVLAFRASINPHLKALKVRLEAHNWAGKPLKALVLGTGGASKAVCYALKTLGVEPLLVSRNSISSGVTYDELTPEHYKTHQIVVNTTPLGMFPHIKAFPPLEYNCLGEGHLLYDLVYNPLMSRFLELGLDNGALVKNGLDMLHLQAEASWTIWNT